MKLLPKISVLILFFYSLSQNVRAQIFIPGESYFDATGFVEYRPGNLPIILSAPHGGDWRPDSIPDRDCAGCTYVNDAYTQEITLGIYEAFFEETGCYPHIIVNRLHRIKFDANRDIDDAADGNDLIEEAWQNYHAMIDTAKAQVVQDYGRGLFLDMHGHAHTIQRIELGYLLSRSELQLSNSRLNAREFIEESSLRTLTGDNIQELTHAELLRGNTSFGSLMQNKGFRSVPSPGDPFPFSNQAYFSGGYNTVRHGSRDNEGEIDAIQIELNRDIRFNENRRTILIDSLTQAAIEYYTLHYNSLFVEQFCNLTTNIAKEKFPQSDFYLFPNPALDYFIVESNWRDFEVHIYNAVGQEILYQEIFSNEKINIQELKSGYYFVQLKKENTFLGVGKLMKNK